MQTSDVLADGFARVHGIVHRVLTGISADALAGRIDPGANSIAWLIWHLTRIQDDHVADVAGTGAGLDRAEGWGGNWFGLPFPVAEPYRTGITSARGGRRWYACWVDLLGEEYHEAVFGHHDQVRAGPPREADLGPRGGRATRIRPVTLGVRLVSVVSDDLQHGGQASYVRGVLERA